MKKLVLSKEEKMNLLEWNCPSSRTPVGNRTEQTSPVTNHNPSGESDNKRSTFTILSNALIRSFRRSVSSAPESPKHISSHRAKPVFDIPGTIFGRSRSKFGHETCSNGTEMDYLSNTSSRTHSNSLHPGFPTCENSNPWETTHPSQFNNDYPPSGRLEDDMPRMLEKFSIKEKQDGTNNCVPFRSRKNSFFSSLRVKSKAPEDSGNAQSNEPWSIFGSFRKILNENESRTVPAGSHSGFLAGERRTDQSENSSSSEDEISRKYTTIPLKGTPELRRKKKMEREAKKKAKQEELKRLHKAQTLQRQLQETEERLRAMETQGVKLERALRGESYSGAQDESQLLHEWFQVALEKNKLNRYESELLLVAKELELEDQQGRLEQKLREKMLIDPLLKDEEDVIEEEEIFAEMMRIIEQRDQLVTSIEEQRTRERSDDLDDFTFYKANQQNINLISKNGLIK
ncbi:hypothetical protein GDO86_008858 [Hymenochirus boettgeri]|uniref:BMERB domain-containing protein n=1 Tax=Hymenochirus boettgeri TaxID=247094 RepID=A0A8T2J6P2_9PIPI|nr:hypothetical protein GDO86_008858 [Hymenochirus boettgeri]